MHTLATALSALWNLAKRDGRDLPVRTVYGAVGNSGRENDVVGKGHEWRKAVEVMSEAGVPRLANLWIRVVSGDGPATFESGPRLIVHTMVVWWVGTRSQTGHASVSAFYDIDVTNLERLAEIEAADGVAIAQNTFAFHEAKWSFIYQDTEVAQADAGEAKYLLDIVRHLKRTEPHPTIMLRDRFEGNVPCFSDLQAVHRWIISSCATS